MLLTDVVGVLDDKKNLVPELNTTTTQKMISSGVISGGMIPKVEESLAMLDEGIDAILFTGSVPVGQRIVAANAHRPGLLIALELGGETRWFELSVSRRSVAPGETPRFMVLSRDITERRAGEAALRESEHMKEAILDAMPATIAVLDGAVRVGLSDAELEALARAGMALFDLYTQPNIWQFMRLMQKEYERFPELDRMARAEFHDRHIAPLVRHLERHPDPRRPGRDNLAVAQMLTRTIIGELSHMRVEGQSASREDFAGYVGRIAEILLHGVAPAHNARGL